VINSQMDEPNRVLGDAGMILRDPSTMHLICHQVGCSPPHLGTSNSATAGEHKARRCALSNGASREWRPNRARSPGTLLQVIRHLEAAVEGMRDPADDDELIFMTRMMQLAVGSRAMLRDRKYCFPDASSTLVHEFYPILSNYITDIMLREENDAGRRTSLRRSLASLCFVPPFLLLCVQKQRPCGGFAGPAVWIVTRWAGRTLIRLDDFCA
jgi:hypothetical protein